MPDPHVTDAPGGAALLRATGISKRFRHVAALEDVDLSLAPGDCTALLGPNGAGKTTLLRILAGVSTPSAGSLTTGPANGIGWVPHLPSAYRRLTTRENLELFSALERAPAPEARATELLERADLVRFADRPAGELSTGTVQRLNIAIALAGRPRALLLDEPTATLSPDQVHRMWEWLQELRREDDLAVLFSTQSVDEAARHAERMVILDRGRIGFAGTVAELVARHGTPGVAESDAADRAFLNLVGPGTGA
jgi:ABC-type multidrug transport system ATPase subunit